MNWLISANTKYFDHERAFEKYNYIEWQQISNYEVGDNVYIYVTAPTQKIQYKTTVSAIDIPYEQINDYDEFWHVSDNSDSTEKNYVKLDLVNQFDGELLSLEELRKNGLNGAPQRPVRLADTTVNYIESILNKIDSDNNSPDFRAIDAKSTRYIEFKNKIIDEYKAFAAFETNRSKKRGNLKTNGGKGRSYPRYLIRLGIFAEEFYNIEIDTFFSR